MGEHALSTKELKTAFPHPQVLEGKKEKDALNTISECTRGLALLLTDVNQE